MLIQLTRSNYIDFIHKFVEIPAVKAPISLPNFLDLCIDESIFDILGLEKSDLLTNQSDIDLIILTQVTDNMLDMYCKVLNIKRVKTSIEVLYGGVFMSLEAKNSEGGEVYTNRPDIHMLDIGTPYQITLQGEVYYSVLGWFELIKKVMLPEIYDRFWLALRPNPIYRHPKATSNIAKVKKPCTNKVKVVPKDYTCECITMKTYIMYDKASKLFKIGASSKPKFRERTLSGQIPLIYILAIYDGFIESILHTEYKDYRVRGEWFRLSTTLLEKLLLENNFYIIDKELHTYIHADLT